MALKAWGTTYVSHLEVLNVLCDLCVAQELFLSSLLPDRKLRVLEQQPLQDLPPGKDGERCLLLWGVEDAVKRRYQQYVQLLEKCRWVWVLSYGLARGGVFLFVSSGSGGGGADVKACACLAVATSLVGADG
jgi:hypothetical protein